MDLDGRVANIGPVSSRRGLVAGNAIAGGIERCFLAGEQQQTAGHRTEVGIGWQCGFTRAIESRVPVFVQHRPGIERLEYWRTNEGVDAALQRLRDIRWKHACMCRPDGQANACQRDAYDRTNDLAHYL